MTEKQIYTRLNRCYLNLLVESKDQYLSDEWVGTDDPSVWEWHRPSEDKSYRMTLKANENGRILLEIKEKADQDYKKVCTFKNEEYNWEPSVIFLQPLNDEIEL